jgi:hypothetical protein
MEEALFADLVQSLKEAKAIARGDVEASRRITVVPSDVKAIREKFEALNRLRLTDAEFARLLGENSILDRMIFAGEKLSDLYGPYDLGWKERAPYLVKHAGEREISGLSAYEQ